MSIRKTPASKIFNEITLAVFRLNARLLSKGDKLVAPLGITSAIWQVLSAIALAPHPLSAPQIAATMRITRQGAQKQLNLGLKAGMVKAIINPRHERSPLYRLTELGQRTFDTATSLETEWMESLVKDTELNELKVTLDTLLSLEARLEDPSMPDSTEDWFINHDKEFD
ncbi:MarR family winged helix-turn-helix transcriptional regulator [Photorhabdus tasmaniensis]|uniref:MarR family winged helix-turn-helix transcriptional regulator n=1 Tax=Photorhabdus tasmaniensis TaxID=1004159 RepID=UPI0040437EA3